MDNQNSIDERQVVKQVLDLLGELDQEARIRVLKTLATFFDVRLNAISSWDKEASLPTIESVSAGEMLPKFSGHKSMSPKEFMLEKDPHTDVDRVVCLGYYLAHYLERPHFKTADISMLNTEAAQRKLSNAAYSVNHAMQGGYFVAAPNGSKQLSVLGEQYIEALPDREAAKEVLKKFRARQSRAGKRNRPKAAKEN